MNILIIDDSLIMRNIHKNILIGKNFPEENILEAQDGKSALDIAVNNEIGLFLVDWNIPGLSGIEFLKAVREIKKYSLTPFIMITSEAAEYNVMEAEEAGVTDYIIKPIKSDQLWKKLNNYII